MIDSRNHLFFFPLVTRWTFYWRSCFPNADFLCETGLSLKKVECGYVGIMYRWCRFYICTTNGISTRLAFLVSIHLSLYYTFLQSRLINWHNYLDTRHITGTGSRCLWYVGSSNSFVNWSNTITKRVNTRVLGPADPSCIMLRPSDHS